MLYAAAAKVKIHVTSAPPRCRSLRRPPTVLIQPKPEYSLLFRWFVGLGMDDPWRTHQMLANPVEQASAIVYLVLSMVTGFRLVESGLLPGGCLMRCHMEAAGARKES